MSGEVDIGALAEATARAREELARAEYEFNGAMVRWVQARKHGGPADAEAFQRAVQAQQMLDAAKGAAREANIAHTRTHKAQWQELMLASAGLSRRALINLVLAIDEVGRTSPAELEGMSADDLRVLFARVLMQRSGP